MGQSVFSGRSAKRVGSLVCLLLSSPLFSFLIQFRFSSEMLLSVKLSCTCALWHCHCSNGRMKQSMERKVPQVKQTQVRFGQSVLHRYLQAKKPRKNVLPYAMCIVMANHVVSHVAFCELQSNKLCFQVPTGSSGLCKLVMTRLE